MNKKYSYAYGHDDVYCYTDSDVLKNKLNVKDAERLYELERQITDVKTRLVYQMADKKRVLGKTFFQAIHRVLFEDIYEWAGKIRTVDIAKGTLFCRTFAIQSELDRIFEELANEEYLLIYKDDELANKMAYYLSELNAVHPFREGNGRVQRLFMEIIAYKAGYHLDFSEVTDEEMIEASYESFNRNYEKMNKIFKKALVKNEIQ